MGGFSPKALGIVAIILGILSMIMPGLTGFSIIMMIGFLVLVAGMLTLALAIYLIMDGAAEIGVGMNLRPRPGSGWLILGGVMSIFLGVMLWMQMPLSGVWAIGILLGVKVFMVGMIMVSGVPPAEGQAA